MIGRQLDLFGGPLKPPKNILIEDEPVVPEPEIVAPEPSTPEVQNADAESEISEKPVQEGAGVHVQMPSSDYPDDSILPGESTPADEQEIEAFKLNELQEEDYTLEEAIAAELVADALPGKKLEDIVAEESDVVEKEEIASSEEIFEIIPDEPAIGEATLAELSEEEPPVEEFVVEEPLVEEMEVEEPVGEEPGPEETEVEEEPQKVEPAEDEPTMNQTDVVSADELEDFAAGDESAPEYLQVEAESEAGKELSLEIPSGDQPMHEELLNNADSMDGEPDWVKSEMAELKPEVALNEKEELSEESAADLILENEAIKFEEAPEPSQEVSFEAIEAEVVDTNEVGPLNIPADQALYSRQYYTMRETANMFNVNQSLLRFWENEFDILKPKKNRKGDRYFRPDDIKNLELIYHLLRVRKFTISGAKDYLKNKAKSLDTFAMVQRLEKLKLFLQELKIHA